VTGPDEEYLRAPDGSFREPILEALEGHKRSGLIRDWRYVPFEGLTVVVAPGYEITLLGRRDAEVIVRVLDGIAEELREREAGGKP